MTGRAVNLENLRDTCKLKTFEGNRTNIGFAFSPSVGNLVTVINQESNNFFAEHLIKHIGLAKYHNGSDESGAFAIIINNFNCPFDDLNKKLEQIFIPLMKY